jgi:hypothetical protein
MKRSGFKPRFERKPERQMDYTPRPRAVAVAICDGKARTSVAVPKRQYVRSASLLIACRALACQHCGRSGPDAGVCAAHSNWAIHGKGKSIKADDNRVASLCFLCHGWLDQGSTGTELEKQVMWWAAHCRTVTELQARGLWPDGVSGPDIEGFPF